MNPHQRLQATITQIEGAYAPATIRAYAADFAAFMRFCDSKNYSALPASSVALAEFIRDLSHSGRSSASIRRAVVGISAIHLLNQFSDPTKGTEARLEMKRMHRTLGRTSKQAFGITQSILTQLLAQVDFLFGAYATPHSCNWPMILCAVEVNWCHCNYVTYAVMRLLGLSITAYCCVKQR